VDVTKGAGVESAGNGRGGGEDAVIRRRLGGDAVIRRRDAAKWYGGVLCVCVVDTWWGDVISRARWWGRGGGARWEGCSAGT
jgi:hypothetical protein